MLTGQDGDQANVLNIIAGKQSMTVWKDTRELAKRVATMVDQIASGSTVEVNDEKTYDNGNKVVPTFLIPPVVVTKDNIQDTLVDVRLLHRGRPRSLTGSASPGLSGGGSVATGQAGAMLRSVSESREPRRSRCPTRRRPTAPSRARPATDTILEMRSITKTFPGVVALQDVSLDVRKGEIHAICGENGAGKSTLMKVLSGVYPHGTYDGEIVFEGRSVDFRNIRDSEHHGIVIIHQELALSPYLSIAENIFLGNERSSRGVIDWNKTNADAASLLAEVGLRDKPETRIYDIGVGKQQLVEIAKALSKEVKLLILDEPTAALNDEDSAHLLALIEVAAPARHHLDHHQPQARRDHLDRRPDDGHPRRPDHQDVRHEGGEGHRGGPDPLDGRPRDGQPIPRADPATSAARSSGSRTGPSTTRSSRSARSSTARRSPCAGARWSVWRA